MNNKILKEQILYNFKMQKILKDFKLFNKKIIKKVKIH